MWKLFGKTRKQAGWLALSIQQRGVTLVHVANTEKPKVTLAEFYPLDNQADLVPLLTRMAKSLHLERFDVTLVLEPGEYQLSLVDAPNVPAEEMRSAVRWLLKDTLAYHVDDATVDVLDVPIERHSPGRKPMMFAVSAHNLLIAARQKALADAQLRLKVIDIPELAQRNIAIRLEHPEQGLAVFTLNASGGLLTVSFQGELYMTRRIDAKLEQVHAAPETDQHVLFDHITLELQRSLDHVDRQYQFISLDRLLLWPSLPETGALAAWLSSNLYVPVEVIDLAQVFDFEMTPELLQPFEQLRYMGVLGAALRQETKTL